MHKTIYNMKGICIMKCDRLVFSYDNFNMLCEYNIYNVTANITEYS